MAKTFIASKSWLRRLAGTLAIIKTNLMKKIVPIILFFNLLIQFTSCNDDENTSNGNSNYVGTYVGNIDTYIDNVFHSNVSKTITLSTLSNTNEFLMDNNIFMTTTCSITNNNLDIPSHTTAETATFSVIEFGTGIFNGNNLTIEFQQNNIDTNTGAINFTGKWVGTLTKQ